MGFIVLLFVVLLLVVLLVAGLLTTVITLVRKHQRRSTTPLVVEDRPDGWTVIHAHPAPLPSHVTLVPALVGMLVAFGVTMISGAKGSFVGLMAQWLVTWIVAGGVLMVWMQSLNNSKRHLQDQPFAVRAEAVRLPNGVEVAAGRIYAVTMRNGLDGHVTVMVTNSTIGALSSIGAAAHSRRLGNISYRIDLDHDGRSSTLAGGLTETQARAVAAEVIRRVRGLV